MRRYRRVASALSPLAVLIGLTGLVGCGQERRFVRACEESTGFRTSVCECAADHAGDELTDDAMSLVIATMEKDTERMRTLGENLTLREAAKAAGFMATVSTRCLLANDSGASGNNR